MLDLLAYLGDHTFALLLPDMPVDEAEELLAKWSENLETDEGTRRFYKGAIKAGIMTLTGGRAFGRRIAMHRDADVVRNPGGEVNVKPDGKVTFSKVDAVFKSTNTTRDNIPSHLIAADDVPPEVADAMGLSLT